MQGSANVSLSSFEQQLVSDTSWILTKNLILQKVSILFSRLAANYCANPLIQQLPPPVKNTTPKISKGENYNGLPWLMLDYPRCFGKEDVFAIRTFFWWGHFFSITLHLKGQYKNVYEKKIGENLTKLSEQTIWMNVTDEEWEYHFETSNMQLLQKNNFNPETKTVLRLACQLNVKNWDEAEEFLSVKCNQLLTLLI